MIAKVILKKKTKAGGITIPDSKMYYKAVIIKTVWYWHENRHLDQWNRIDHPEIDPQTYGELIFDKAGKNIQWNKDSLFQQMVLGKLDSDVQKNESDHFPPPYTKINSKWMKGLNVRQETIKILEEKAGKNLFDLGCSNLLNISPEARETKAKMIYWNLIKIKTFCTVKETFSKTKRQWTEWEKIFSNDISDKGLVSKIYKELTNSTPKNQIIQ